LSESTHKMTLPTQTWKLNPGWLDV